LAGKNEKRKAKGKKEETENGPVNVSEWKIYFELLVPWMDFVVDNDSYYV